MTQTITIKQTRDNLADIINQVAYTGKSFTVTKYGQPQATISPPKTTKAKSKHSSRQKKLDKLFGAWSHRTDIKDSVKYAQKLREQAFNRQ